MNTILRMVMSILVLLAIILWVIGFGDKSQVDSVIIMAIWIYVVTSNKI